MKNWDSLFLNLANHISSWSKDKSVGVAAIITSKDNRILSVGYNGFPTGCNDNKKNRHIKPQKYLWTEHAERNAIFSAAKNGININNSIIYLNWYPCADCARAIIQSGIKKIICPPPDYKNLNWGNQFKVSTKMFKECKIKIKHVKN